MYLTTTELGKAYEYACLMALKNHLAESLVSSAAVNSYAFAKAKSYFEKAEKAGVSARLVPAANAAARVILRLEPQLQYGSGTLSLSIQDDSRGIAGDVRDVVCARRSDGWEMGISCKHNHHAVKHSRLSATIDFGADWLGIPCSRDYFNTVTPIFNELRDMRDRALRTGGDVPLWNDLPNKFDGYYIPVLEAFLAEMRRLAGVSKDVPGRLIHYMLGRNDFYKVITDDFKRTTRIEAINISGTLNRPAGGHQSIVDVDKLKLPTRFYHMGMVPDSNNTVEIVCDEGWTLTMRIHNASSKIEPSLKFDVQLASLPSSIHAQVEPW